MVSNAPANQITGLDEFLGVFNTPEVKAEVTPFRFVIQRKQRRSMGGKFSQGLTHEITENVEINPNEDLFGLRRWIGQVRQDPASVMLLNIGKVKEEAMAAPLGFSEMMKSGRPVLISSTDREMRDQLMARIDLTFTRVPQAVLTNPVLGVSLRSRIQRKKGFIGSVRPLLDLEFISQPLMQKLIKINAGGDPSELTDPELVNAMLVGDLYSRYRQALTLFKEQMQNSSMNIQQMMSMFDLLLADIPLAEAVKAFAEFYPKDNDPSGQIQTKADLFGHLNQFVNAQEGSSRAQGRSQKVDVIFKRITSLVVEYRSKIDPVLFERCSFIYNRTEDEKNQHNNLIPVFHYLGKVIDAGEEAIKEEFKQNIGNVVYELVQIANLSDEQARASGAQGRQRVAQALLPMFSMAKFQASHLVQISPQNRDTLLNKEKFINLFRNLPMTVQDLREIWKRLDQILNHNQVVTDEVRRSTLDVIEGAAATREKALREIYIVNAALELVNYPFHVGEAKISMVERLCGLSVIQNRLGFEASLAATQPTSIGIFTRPNEKSLGKLQNDPAILSRAYTALIALQVEKHVKKVIDKKIGYLQSTFGENFFEVIYQNVVAINDLPLSRTQLAWFIRTRGLLGNLSEKGFRTEQENDLVDNCLTLEGPTIPGKKKETRSYKEFDSFEQLYQTAQNQFLQLLNDLKTAGASKDPTSDVHALIWSLFRRGIYNLNRGEAKEVFRKSVFYNTLREAIARVSSENYSIFTKDIQAEGVKIFVHPSMHFLLTVGSRFNFLIEKKVVRYQLVGSPVSKPEDLDALSRTFHEKLSALLSREDSPEEIRALKFVGDEILRITRLWYDYSRFLTFALLDRLLTESVIKELVPGDILPLNLWYLKDDVKLCLGPAMTTQQNVPFTKILQVPENMGNIQKNNRSSSTTIDDFTIEVHKITHVRNELLNIQGIAEDVLDILQNLTHERAESALVTKYEQTLMHLTRVLDKPLRYFTEKDVQAMHTVAAVLRSTLQAFYNTPGSQKDQLVQRVQAQLRSRRSDGHTLKMNFTDGFILDKTTIKVMQKERVGDEIVSKQRKMEVEVDATYQTLPSRIREVIRVHQILANKQHVVFSPEGQKKNQLNYVL
ncbi:MAG: hypothetical protein OEW39_08390, partial [Deltaproteobacteria bacterium]|nr:hypothetical protein [Deltaproteobacteria bacterium]